MERLHEELKRLIIDPLRLEALTPADIDANAPLFGDGLGLDSVDALELAFALKRRYGVEPSPNSQQTRKYFASVAALADLVRAQRQTGTA